MFYFVSLKDPLTMAPSLNCLSRRPPFLRIQQLDVIFTEERNKTLGSNWLWKNFVRGDTTYCCSRPSWTTTRRDGVFFFTGHKINVTHRNECDMTSQRQSVGISFCPFRSHEMPPSFRLQKKNVCNPVKGFGERVSRVVWEIHWTRDSTSSSDTEYCLQSSDPTRTPSAVSEYMSLSPRPCVDTPMSQVTDAVSLKTPNIKIFST